MNFRKAQMEDLNICWSIIKEARDYLKSQGIDQWQQEYPDISDITRDIEREEGYVLDIDGQIAAYTCISFEGEPAYDSIRGAWKSIQPYGVIHRMATSGFCKGMGLASELFRYGEALCRSAGIHSIKIDTDQDNQIMKHLLEKNGYEYCGEIIYAGTEKIGYEKLI